MRYGMMWSTLHPATTAWLFKLQSGHWILVWKLTDIWMVSLQKFRKDQRKMRSFDEIILLRNQNTSSSSPSRLGWSHCAGTLHLKSRQRRREIYFPKYIYIFVLSIEKRLGVNCPNLGKIIERRWSDNFTRFEWSSSRGCTNVESIHFLKDADYRNIIGKNN